MLGLVLTAGGARGAYQAGVLKRLSEQPALRRRPSPFAIIAGSSAGAINGALLAARAEQFGTAARASADLWSNLALRAGGPRSILRRSRGAARCSRATSCSAVCSAARHHGPARHVAARALIAEAFPARGIAAAIRRGDLYAVALSATSYHSGRSYTFIQGRAGHPVWTKSRRVVMPVTLTHEHILASSAIPIVFPPVQIRSAGASSGSATAAAPGRADEPGDPARRDAPARRRCPLVARGRLARAGRGRESAAVRAQPARAAARAGVRRVHERDLPRPPRRRSRFTCAA
jgi:NTE family protein